MGKIASFYVDLGAFAEGKENKELLEEVLRLWSLSDPRN